MTAAVQNIYTALAPLRLYALNSGGLIDSELAAYDAAFAVVEQLLDEVLARAFVQTASGEALARYEKLVGLSPRQKLADATRRELVLYRLAVAPFDFHREGMASSIRAAGMEAELVEHPAAEALTVRCREILDPSLDLDSLTASVRAMLPAHLAAEIDIGSLTWDRFDAADPDWDDWDAADMTWTAFDLDGHNIFTEQGGI